MTRPTREQIEAARTLAQVVVDTCEESPLTNILRILLSATAEPTDEELAEEVAELRGVSAKHVQADDYDIAWYRDGARREGAR